MNRVVLSLNLLITAALLLTAGHSVAEEIRVAAASNFSGAITALAEGFEADTGHEVTLIFGSTGKHYAQIKHGAPYDAFFAADKKRPEILEQEGLALPESRFTYAIGKIVLWSPRADVVDSDGKVLEQGKFRHLAIANPKLAPYGKAAQQVLQTRELWNSLKQKMVRGENIGQTFQFVSSGNAEMGFVAYSQVLRFGRPIEGSFWEVPQSQYAPIEQQAILLKENKTAQDFLLFVKSDRAQEMIHRFGYGTP